MSWLRKIYWVKRLRLARNGFRQLPNEMGLYLKQVNNYCLCPSNCTWFHYVTRWIVERMYILYVRFDDVWLSRWIVRVILPSGLVWDTHVQFVSRQLCYKEEALPRCSHLLVTIFPIFQFRHCGLLWNPHLWLFPPTIYHRDWLIGAYSY